MACTGTSPLAGDGRSRQVSGTASPYSRPLASCLMASPKVAAERDERRRRRSPHQR